MSTEQSQREQRTAPRPPELIERSADDQAKTVIAGYASLFNNRTTIYGMFTESVRPGAFKRAIAERQDVRTLFNHSPDIVLGRTTNGTLALSEDEKGLWTETNPPNTQQARDIVENIRVGNIDQMSFGFMIRKQEWKLSATKGELDHREIIDVDLFDISPVAFAAYPDTTVGLRSAAEDAHRLARAEYERALEAALDVKPAGVDPAHLARRLRLLQLSR